MNSDQVTLAGRRRRSAAFAFVGGAAIASAIAASDLDQFVENLKTVAVRDADAIAVAEPTILATAGRTRAAIRAPELAPSAAVAWVPPIGREARVVVPPTPRVEGGQPAASARSAVRPTTPTAPSAIGVVSVAARYHLPTPALAERRGEPTFPSYPTSVLADADGRAVELADAEPRVARVLPRSTTPSVRSLASAGVSSPTLEDVAAPLPIVATVPAASSPIAATRGHVLVATPSSTVDGAGLSDASADAADAADDDAGGWTPSAGVQVDGTAAAPGNLAWETVVSDGGNGGIRGSQMRNWTPGDGTFQQVVINADGSVTILPEPTSLLGVALAGALLRRRR